MTSHATRAPCERCGRPIFATLCVTCKAELRTEERHRAMARQAKQDALGFVGDEARAKATIASFDAFSTSLRASLGCEAGAADRRALARAASVETA
jgi:hypothetical protein